MTTSVLLERSDDLLQRLAALGETGTPCLLFLRTELSPYVEQSPLWMPAGQALLAAMEEAPEHWLAQLLAVMQRYEIDAVFGPVRGRAPGSVRKHRDYLERFFSRTGPDQTGPIEGFFGCGNSLIRRTSLPDPARTWEADRRPDPRATREAPG